MIEDFKNYSFYTRKLEQQGIACTLDTRLLDHSPNSNRPSGLSDCVQWRHQKEEVGWVLASVRQPNAEGVKNEGRGAAETSAIGAEGVGYGKGVSPSSSD